MNIISGKQIAPVKGIIYGPEKSGKSSLASMLPSPVFIDIEHGTANLDVSRLPCETIAEVKESIKWLAMEQHNFATVVIDSADWLEQMIVKAIIEKAKDKEITSIEDFGYGKGWTKVAETWKGLLDLSAPLSRRGMNVIFISHSRVKTVNEPGKDQGYEHYEMNVAKQANPLLGAWADMILFINFFTRVTEVKGRPKVMNGRDRRIYTTHCAIYDAGNRYGLPEELNYDFDDEKGIPILPVELASIFNARSGQPILQKASVAYKKPVQPEAKATIVPEAAKPSEGIQAPPEDAPEPTLDMIIDQLAWLEKSKVVVEAYMLNKAWITVGQTWKDASASNLNRILKKPDDFCAALGIKK
jgi:hypothetical protein